MVTKYAGTVNTNFAYKRSIGGMHRRKPTSLGSSKPLIK